MTIVVTDSTPAQGATYTAGGITEVVANGDFQNATVSITAQSDGSEPAPVYTFWGPGAVSLQAAPGTTLGANIVGAGPSSIDVSMNP